MEVGVTAAKVGKVRFGRDIALTTQPATNSAANKKMWHNNKADETVHSTTKPVRSKTKISRGFDKHQINQPFVFIQEMFSTKYFIGLFGHKLSLIPNVSGLYIS